MKIWYEAADGEMFDSEDLCLSHEASLTHKHLKDIDFYSEHDHSLYSIDMNNVFNDRTYVICEKMVIHNLDELTDLLWLADECGWSEFYEQINKPGTWIRFEEGGEGFWNLVNDEEIKGE